MPAWCPAGVLSKTLRVEWLTVHGNGGKSVWTAFRFVQIENSVAITSFAAVVVARDPRAVYLFQFSF